MPTGVLETAAGVAAAGLALTSTGSMVVAAVLVGVAARSRWTIAACLLAVAAVAVRFSTVSFDDLAGIQSVLGAAGTIGPSTGAASAWVAAAAVVASVRTPWAAALVHRGVVALAAGAVAATIAVGPGPGGALDQRIAATVVATTASFAVGHFSGRHRTGEPGADRVRAVLAIVAGVAAVVLAGWPA